MAYEVSQRRACRTLGFPRATHRYQSVRDDRAELRIRLRDLAASRVHYGYKRLHILLMREGWTVNHKLVYRLYCEEGLQMRKKQPRRHKTCSVRRERSQAGTVNETWSMDFMADQLLSGHRIRILTLVYSRFKSEVQRHGMPRARRRSFSPRSSRQGRQHETCTACSAVVCNA